MKTRIKAEHNYYSGTLYAPKDGYLMDYPVYDPSTKKEYSDPLEFDSVEDAYKYLTNCDELTREAMFCDYDGDGCFSRGGIYVTHHGQHSRPRYTIVSAKSGRCTKAIVSECEKINSILG